MQSDDAKETNTLGKSSPLPENSLDEKERDRGMATSQTSLARSAEGATAMESERNRALEESLEVVPTTSDQSSHGTQEYDRQIGNIQVHFLEGRKRKNDMRTSPLQEGKDGEDHHLLRRPRSASFHLDINSRENTGVKDSEDNAKTSDILDDVGATSSLRSSLPPEMSSSMLEEPSFASTLSNFFRQHDPSDFPKKRDKVSGRDDSSRVHPQSQEKRDTRVPSGDDNLLDLPPGWKIQRGELTNVSSAGMKEEIDVSRGHVTSASGHEEQDHATRSGPSRGLVHDPDHRPTTNRGPLHAPNQLVVAHAPLENYNAALTESSHHLIISALNESRCLYQGKSQSQDRQKGPPMQEININFTPNTDSSTPTEAFARLPLYQQDSELESMSKSSSTSYQAEDSGIDQEFKPPAASNGARATPGTNQNDQWMARYQDLVVFRQSRGHCKIPYSYSENPALAQWVKRQRYQFKLKVKGKHSHLTSQRQELLEDIDFAWDSHDAAWEENFAMLAAFRREKRHCHVPVRMKQLSTWAKRQRRQYKLWRAGKPSTLTKERVRRMDKLNFPWLLSTATSSSNTSGSIVLAGHSGTSLPITASSMEGGLDETSERTGGPDGERNVSIGRSQESADAALDHLLPPPTDSKDEEAT